jgi:hypothetical protein
MGHVAARQNQIAEKSWLKETDNRHLHFSLVHHLSYRLNNNGKAASVGRESTIS